MGKLQDKVALVTGSSSGIGRGVAIAFAREGAKVIVNYPDEAEAQNAAAVRAEVERMGTQALDVRADVSIEHEAEKLVETVQRNFGRIDILVNNAGIGNVARVEAMAPSQWDRMIAVNLRSVFPVHALRAADHVPTGLWQDHQHRLAARLQGQRGPGALLRGQGRDHRVHPLALARDRHEQHYR